MKNFPTFEEFVNEKEMGKYSLVKVGGFRIGDYPSIAAAKRAFKEEEEVGFYQIIDNSTGFAVWEGDKK